MDFAVLDSEVLCISESDWFCELTRDNYLEHFLSLLSCIDEDPDLKLAWSDLYDELMWESPQKLPWKQDVMWRNKIVPQLYQKITKNSEYKNRESIPCSITPEMCSNENSFYPAFKLLLGALHEECLNIYIFLGLSSEGKKYEFDVGGERLNPSPFVLEDSDGLLECIDFSEKYWPESADDSENLRNGVMFLLSRDYEIETPSVEFVFARKFLRKLSNTTSDRCQIMNMIAKRLSVSSAEARACCFMRDEVVSSGEHRFRVTQRPTSKRIHYEFEDGKIKFLMFYDIGEHDDGL